MSTDDPVLFVSSRMCDIVPPRGCPRIIGRLNRAFTGRYWLPASVVASRIPGRVRVLRRKRS
jgi:hypothetical protein